MITRLGWGTVALAIGAFLYFLAFHALVRPKAFVKRMNRMSYGSATPPGKGRRGEGPSYLGARFFAGPILLFLGTVSVIAAISTFAGRTK